MPTTKLILGAMNTDKSNGLESSSASLQTKVYFIFRWLGLIIYEPGFI
jgi:hypothetical protein